MRPIRPSSSRSTAPARSIRFSWRTPESLPADARDDAGRLAPAVRARRADERQLPGRRDGPGLADRHRGPADRDPRRPVRVSWGTLPAPAPRRRARSGRPSSRSRACAGSSASISSGTQAREHATILEINPRPTTSYVGLSRLLPPGRLAAAWLGAFDPESAGAALLPGLARAGSRAGAPCPSMRPECVPRRRESSHERHPRLPIGRPGSAWISAGPTSRPPTATGRPGRSPSRSGSGPTSWAGRSRRPRRRLPPSDRAAVTMTAELCDCYPDQGRRRQRGPRRRGRGPARAARSSSGALTASFTRWPRSASGRCSPPRPTGWRWRPWRPG